MHSLRTKITLLAVFVAVVAVAIVTLLSVFFIRNNERRQSEQLLLLLCETGERNLDYYFDSVQKSVRKVASFAEKDLTGLDDAELERHMASVGAYFEEMANKTNGVLTYYYRVDPVISDTVKGFWYTDLDGQGFVPHEVTDITQYDTSDTTHLVWFTVPKYEGTPIWLPPYITDNLDVRVISYNIPVYWRGQFVGVMGIEVDYSTMAEQVESIRLYSNGYAFLSDAEGTLFFHPRIDVSQLTEETMPETPEGAVGDSTFLRYTFEGVEKQAAWLSLRNGMRLVVTVPVSETEGDWQTLIRNILVVSALVLIVLIVFTMYLSRLLSKPLNDLTKAALLVDQGRYDFELNYSGDDEVGRLTSTFRHLADHMKEHIDDLNERVYVDALTHVRNKGAFVDYVQELQDQLDACGGQMAFALGVFDTDDLKSVNDMYGHDKGDIYIRSACRLICTVFQHSPVFRIGGDEFAVVLQKEDYENREELVRQFEAARHDSIVSEPDRWKQASVAMGIADYDPENDRTVTDVLRRADKVMYENKRLYKAAQNA